MRTRLSVLLAFSLLAGIPAAASAQVNPAFSDLTAALDEARTTIGTERKQLVAQAIALTPEEAARFWPLYDQYMADLKEAGDLRIKLITDYAANMDTLTDRTAGDLIQLGFKWQEAVIKVRKNYLGKFGKILPTTKVARFYQLEYKLDAITNFAITRQVPLVPQATPSAPLAPPAGQ